MGGSEKPPMGGSEKPPMGGSEKPPMGGSEKPPMGESEKPPMGGSEKPPMEGTEKPSQGGEATSSPGCKCGVKRTQRIVGGTETEINEYPWMAGIATSFEAHYCGGTLVASQWVVSAAHCFFDKNGENPTQASDVRIVLGEHDTTITTESKIPRKVVEVSIIKTHPDYVSDTSNNDIALLKLSEEVDLNVYTPACLPNTKDNFEGKNAWVYGWGYTSYGGVSPNELLEVEVPIVSNDVCAPAMAASGRSPPITETMVCAGGLKGRDGCQGDSGGPLTVDVNGQHVLVGDVSFGVECGLEGLYGVYGDVAYFRSWIDTFTADNGGPKYCPA